MTLIHCAMLSEAQYIIEKLKLKLEQRDPKIYTNDKIILVVSGIGKENTLTALKLIFSKFTIKKAINIGIAGSSDKTVKIGELFCTNQRLENIKYMELNTVDTPQIKEIEDKKLFDMESKYFQELSLKYLDPIDIYVYKVVSDYLEDKILSKEFVKQLIKNAIDINKLNFLD